MTKNFLNKILLKDFDWWLRWISTALLIVGSMLTSTNIYPLNVVFSFLGNVGWMVAGYRMKEPSLWAVSLFLVVIYFYGIAFPADPSSHSGF